MATLSYGENPTYFNDNIDFSTSHDRDTRDDCYLKFDQINPSNQNSKQPCVNKQLNENYYHLPGYSGKIPQEFQMFGLTRSEMSRRVFRNPHIYTRPDTLFSPAIDSIHNQTLNIRSKSSIKDQIYMPNINISGYTGHIPTMQEKFGKTLKNLFLKSIVDFEENQTEKRNYKFDFKLQKLLDNNCITKQDLPINSMVIIH